MESISGEKKERKRVKTTQETTQERIVSLLRNDPGLTRKVIAEKIGITPDGVKYHLGKLKKAGKIKRIGSTKKGQWKIIDYNNE